jgi:hypothetical protein
MLVVKSRRLSKKLLGVAGRILGTAGTGKPPRSFSIDAAKNLLGSRTKSAKVLYHKEHKEHKESNVRRATGVNPWVYY